MKYIVKNCENLSTSYYSDGRIIKHQCGLTVNGLCENTNCLIKDVITKCEAFTQSLQGLRRLWYRTDCIEAGKNIAGKEILEIFNIENVEEVNNEL